MKKQNKRIQQKRCTIWSYSQLEFSFARSSTNFLNLGTIIILDQTILCCGGCPAHCQVSSSTPGLHPPDANSTLPSRDNQKYLQTWPNIFSEGCGGAPSWEPLISVLCFAFGDFSILDTCIHQIQSILLNKYWLIYSPSKTKSSRGSESNFIPKYSRW